MVITAQRQGETVRDYACRIIKENIVTMELKPGSLVSETELAKELGVSRTPVREALRMLEQEKLVLLIPRKGAQVLDMSADDIKNIMEIRGALEVLAMKHACKNMSKEKIDEMKALNVEFEKAFKEKDDQRVSDVDVLFHNIIMESANNDVLCVLVNNMRTRAYRYRIASAYLAIKETSETVIEHHKQIVEAIENHTEEEGVAIMAEHIEYQMLEILKSLKK